MLVDELEHVLYRRFDTRVRTVLGELPPGHRWSERFCVAEPCRVVAHNGAVDIGEVGVGLDGFAQLGHLVGEDDGILRGEGWCTVAYEHSTLSPDVGAVCAAEWLERFQTWSGVRS